MAFPTINNFRRRPGSGAAGQTRFLAEQEPITAGNRDSILVATSPIARRGLCLAYSATPPVRAGDTAILVTVPVAGFTAAQFAGFVPYYEYENDTRVFVRLNDTTVPRESYPDEPIFKPGESFARTVSGAMRWIYTDLLVAPTPGAAVQILTGATTGGYVSSAGGVAVPGLVFGGELAKDEITGRQMATVQHNLLLV